MPFSQKGGILITEYNLFLNVDKESGQHLKESKEQSLNKFVLILPIKHTF